MYTLDINLVYENVYTSSETLPVVSTHNTVWTFAFVRDIILEIYLHIEPSVIMRFVNIYI